MVFYSVSQGNLKDKRIKKVDLIGRLFYFFTTLKLSEQLQQQLQQQQQQYQLQQ
jgi:hypothetical protein